MACLYCWLYGVGHRKIYKRVNKKRKAELCDAIILEFYGDKSFAWHQLHGAEKKFNHLVKDSDCDKGTDADAKYFVLQPLINLLLEDGVLQRMLNNTPEAYVCLTDKGNAMLPYLNHRGYVTMYKKENKKNLWIYISGGLIIATFLILIYNTWIKQLLFSSQPNNTATPTSTQLATPLDTGKLSAKPDSLSDIDTPKKSLPILKKENKKKETK